MCLVISSKLKEPIKPSYFEFDLKKAFDVVDHEMLLQKLALYGVRGTSLRWFESYLSNRSQCVVDGLKVSSRQSVKSVVWGNTTNANLTRLVKLQKRAARIILKVDFMTPSEQLFKELIWLSFPKRVQYHTCLTVYKSITGQTPEYISIMLTYISEHHDRQTRSTVLDLLHIPRSHSAYFDKAFSVQGPKLWNSLPADIRNSTSINRFKRQLKRYLLYND